MPAVLTEESDLRCTHQGTVVVVAGTRALTVGGAAVLVLDDMLTATVTGCPQSPTPCALVTAVAQGASTTLTTGGRPVLLATASGTTNAGQWQVMDAKQSKLEAL